MTRIAGLLAVGLMVLGLTVSSGVSQDKKTDDKGDKKAKGQIPSGWKKLELSTDQKSKIYAVQADYKVKIKVLEEQIKQLRSQEYADMVKVLTDKQRAELAKGLVPDEPKKKPDDKK